MNPGERVAASIAKEVGLTEYRASLLPEDRVTTIHELVEKYGEVAMIGDGVNDTPALAASTVGIAIIFHAGSTLAVVANALRLLRFSLQSGD